MPNIPISPSSARNVQVEIDRTYKQTRSPLRRRMMQVIDELTPKVKEQRESIKHTLQTSQINLKIECDELNEKINQTVKQKSTIENSIESGKIKIKKLKANIEEYQDGILILNKSIDDQIALNNAQRKLLMDKLIDKKANQMKLHNDTLLKEKMSMEKQVDEERNDDNDQIKKMKRLEILNDLQNKKTSAEKMLNDNKLIIKSMVEKYEKDCKINHESELAILRQEIDSLHNDIQLLNNDKAKLVKETHSIQNSTSEHTSYISEISTQIEKSKGKSDKLQAELDHSERIKFQLAEKLRSLKTQRAEYDLAIFNVNKKKWERCKFDWEQERRKRIKIETKIREIKNDWDILCFDKQSIIDLKQFIKDVVVCLDAAIDGVSFNVFIFDWICKDVQQVQLIELVKDELNISLNNLASIRNIKLSITTNEDNGIIDEQVTINIKNGKFQSLVKFSIIDTLESTMQEKLFRQVILTTSPKEAIVSQLTNSPVTHGRSFKALNI
ncbi:hypothetical protein DAMA08_002080 [Martiniozyma asiatica (nom. inval.)]|nr:hypothetical protein DAMA08_002080 [Martiniozyma asiatica]